MESLEDYSPVKKLAHQLCTETTLSFRDISAQLGPGGATHTTVQKWARLGNWKRPAKVEAPEWKPRVKPVEALPAPEPVYLDDPAPKPPSATTKDLTERGRGIILALMAELEYLNQNASILMELVDANFNGEKDGATKAKLMKALDHEVRTKSSNQLATALAKLNDAAPTKKEERQDNAEKSSSAGRFAAPSAPRTTMQ